MLANRYHNTRFGVSIEVPYGWHEHRGVLARLLDWYGDVNVRFVPRGRKYPQLAIHMRETRMSTADDMKKLMAAVSTSMRVTVIKQDKVSIGGQAGFAVRYIQSDHPP